jgi:hypothetical protein
MACFAIFRNEDETIGHGGTEQPPPLGMPSLSIPPWSIQSLTGSLDVKASMPPGQDRHELFDSRSGEPFNRVLGNFIDPFLR